jgi:predicted Zn-dependent peptidase
VLGPAQHIRETFTRDAIVAFRSRRWSPAQGAAFAVGNLDGLGDNGALDELFGRFTAGPEPAPYDPAPPAHPRVMVRERDSNQSHLRMSYRPALDVSSPAQRAAMVIYATLLGGSMGSRLFDEIREQRGLAYSVSAFPHAYADVPIVQLSAGLDSAKCVEAYRRMREIVTELREQGPTEAEVARARAYAAGARTIAFENTGAVARYAASQTITLLDQVTYDDVRAVAAEVADELSVACVGPHTVEELEAA